MKEVVVAMEAVDLQAKQMKEQSLELKKEGPLFVHKVVQKSPFKSPKKSTKWSGNKRYYQCDQAGHYGRDKCCSSRQVDCSKCKW